jgi:hypothetical protein
MNPRERTLLVALVSVVGSGIVLIAGYYWFWAPLKAYERTIVDMRAKNNDEQAVIDQFNRDKKRMAMARVKSLPSNQNEASTEYVNYINWVLPRAGLRVEEVLPGQNAVEVKPVSSIPNINIKKTGHQMLTFTVKARGTMSALAAALAEFQNTPYEHRIKTMTIDRADTTTKDESAKLIVNMIIETLIVSKAESKAGVPPGVDLRGALFDSLSSHYNMPTAGLGQMFATMYYNQMKQPETSRRYADMTKRNIFIGETVKIIVDPPPPEPPPPPTPIKSPGPIPQYVRLVGIETNRGEAHYLNLFYRKDERKISEKENSGYNTFLIASDDKTYTFLYGKVLKVEHRDVFFQVKDKVYKWHLGDTLAAAWGDNGLNYLSLDFLDAADVEPDFAWGKKELEKDAEIAKTKTPTKKTKGGKGK